MENNFTIRKAERKDVGLLPFTTFQIPLCILDEKSGIGDVTISFFAYYINRKVVNLQRIRNVWNRIRL